MTEHFEKQDELPARGPMRERGGTGGTRGADAERGMRGLGAIRGSRRIHGLIRLGLVFSVGLVCALPARVQSGEPPADDASGGPRAAAPLPGDGAAPPAAAPIDTADASDAAGEDAPWNQGVDVDRRHAARKVFLEGNDLARKRFFATAAAKYRQAIELWPHPAFSYNLALAQLQLDQSIEAHASLQRAVEHGPAPLGDRYEQARQQLARIESELGAIEVTCAEPGARVMLDGKPVFTGPGTYRGVVRPGAHQLVAIRRGLAPVVEQLVLAPGEQGSVALVFEYPETEVTEKRRRWAAWKPYTVVTTGAALVLAGAVLDWHSTRMFDDYDSDYLEACPIGCMPGMEPSGLGDRQSQAESEQRLAVIGYAAGGVVLATGIVLSYVGRERTYRKRVRVAPDAERTLQPSTTTGSIVPLVAPGAIGASAGFRF
jgi:hypothetical protein